MFVFRKYQSGALGYDVRGVRLQIMKISNEIDSNGEAVTTETVIGSFELTTESETPVEKKVSESYNISLLHNDKIIVRASMSMRKKRLYLYCRICHTKSQHQVILKHHGKIE